MQSYCNSTADKWIASSQYETIPLDQVKDCWPWETVTPDQWTQFNKERRFVTSVNRLGQLLAAMCICPIGMVGSLLCAASIWRRAIAKKERLYRWMFAISLLDLLFNTFFTSYSLAHGSIFQNLKSYQYVDAMIRYKLSSLTVGLSLASDMCTVCLTLERLLTLLQKTTVQINVKKPVTIIEIFLIAGFAIARFSMAEMQWQVADVRNDTSLGIPKYDHVKNPIIQQSQTFNTLLLITNSIAPFALLFFMIFLSVWIGIIAFKRRKSKIFTQASAQTQQEIQQQSAAITRLCFSLSFLFFLCQIGYCVSAILRAISNHSQYTFSSTYEFITFYELTIAYVAQMSTAVKIGLECLSKSGNFLIYMLFTETFRYEFRLSMRRLFCRKM